MNHLLGILLVLLAVHPAPTAHGAEVPEETVTVEFPMESQVLGTEVELGEVARVTGSDETLVRRVRELELGYAPSPGYSRVFRTDRVRATLERKLPGIAVTFTGQGATRVYPVVERIESDALRDVARTRLLAIFNSSEFTFQERGSVPDVEVPQGATPVRVEARLGKAPERSGVLVVPVDILVDGERYRTVQTHWDVVTWETRHVLDRPLRAGQVLRREHFVRSRVEVANDRTGDLDWALLEGSVAVRDLMPGAAVKASDVQRPRVVAPGEMVRLQVQRGAIRARVMAFALEPGAIGDRIRVKTIETSTELVATIASRDLCVIQLDR